MSKVVFSISISLEGSSPGPTEPKAVAEAGAVIVGRRTYDDSIRWWGADGPTGATRLPTFVVTHQPPESSPEGGVYAFVDGVEAAIEQAKTAAGDKTVAMG